MGRQREWWKPPETKILTVTITAGTHYLLRSGLVFERLMQVCDPTCEHHISLPCILRLKIVLVVDMWSIGYPPQYRDCDGNACCCNTGTSIIPFFAHFP